MYKYRIVVNCPVWIPALNSNKMWYLNIFYFLWFWENDIFGRSLGIKYKQLATLLYVAQGSGKCNWKRQLSLSKSLWRSDQWQSMRLSLSLFTKQEKILSPALEVAGAAMVSKEAHNRQWDQLSWWDPKRPETGKSKMTVSVWLERKLAPHRQSLL